MGGGMIGGAVRTEDPVIGGHFYLTVSSAGIDEVPFQTAGGFGSENEVAEFKGTKKGDYHTIQQVPGRLKWQKITLKGPVTTDMTVWNWRKKVEEGDVDSARADGSIILVNQKGAPVAQWNFFRGYPAKVGLAQVDSGNNQTSQLEVEIVHEKCERVPV